MPNVHGFGDMKDDSPSGPPRGGGNNPPNIPFFPPQGSSGGNIKHITSESEFNTLIGCGKLVVVDFFATWCGPCTQIAPFFASLPAKYPGVVFAKVDVDQLNEVAMKQSVSAMPTFHLYHNRKLVDSMKGANPSGLESLINKHKGVSSGPFSGTGHKLTDPNSTPATSNPSYSNSSTGSSNVFGGSGHKLTEPSAPSPTPSFGPNNSGSSQEVNEVFVKGLIEMGFEPQQAHNAVKATKGSSLEAALEWCVDHPAPIAPSPSSPSDVIPFSSEPTPEAKMPDTFPSPSSATETPQADDPMPEVELKPKSLRCADCGIVLANEKQVSTHAQRTGHVDFEEDTQEVAPKKPLTPEEKEEQKKKLQERLQEMRLQKEREEKERELEREKNRIKMGKETAEAKKLWQEKQLELEAQKRKKEKEEDRLAKEKIRKQIELDKLNRQKQRQGGTQSPAATPEQTPKADPVPITMNVEKVVLQIRMPTGPPIKVSFQPRDTMHAVFAHVSMLLGHERFSLLTTFPRKTYTKGNSNLDTNLIDAELVPNGVVICQTQ